MNEKLIEYDKRIGVPKFEGWQEREVKAHLDRLFYNLGIDEEIINESQNL